MDKVEAAKVLEELRESLHKEFNRRQSTLSLADRKEQLDEVLRIREALAEGANCLRNIEQWRREL
jgi:hypothetical protein